MFSYNNIDIKNLDGKIDFWVVNPLQNVYRCSELPENPQTKIELVSALNEYENMQIALRSSRAFTVTSIDFTGANAENFSYHFVEYEEKAATQAENSITPWTTNMTLYPLSVVPDPLSNETSVSVSANETQAVFITHYAPADMKPGMYESSVIIRTTSGDVEVAVIVTVCNVKIPCIADANLVNYHWTMTNGFSDGIAWDRNSKPAYDAGKWYYDIQTYSGQWFELMNEFASVLTRYRNNMIWVRTDLFLREKGFFLSDFTKEMPNNLDWSLFDRYVQIFIDKGIVRFANTHLVHALYHMPEEERPTEKTKKQWQKSIPDKLPVTDTFLTNYLTALYLHLKEKGWTKQNGFTWYQHIRDEPIYAEHKNWWAYVARKIKQINAETGSEFVTMDADPDGILLADDSKCYMDVMVPYTKGFFKRRDDFKKEQTAGKELWVYTMEVNRPPWLNRFWTQPTLTGRLLYWNISQENIKGHLHWAWNAWYRGPWDGDTYIVYPDKKHMTVKSTIRQEAMRDGIEDYELLNIIKQSNPYLAAKLAQCAVNSDDPTKYTLSPEYIKTLHDYMVKAAAGEDAGEIPQSDVPYIGQDVPMTRIVKNMAGVGDWAVKNRRFAYLGTVQSTNQPNAYLEYEFYGKGIDVIVQKGAEMGKIAITVDNMPSEIVNAYEGVPHDYFTIFQNHSLTEGKHTIKVENIENKKLSFDCFRVYLYKGIKIYDPSLDSIEITGADIHFHSDIRDYQIILDNDINNVNITPKLRDAEGICSINGRRADSGESISIDIPAGKSKVEIVTLAGDNLTSAKYTLSFLKFPDIKRRINVAACYSKITADGTRSGEEREIYGPEKMVDGSYDTMFAVALQYTGAEHPFPHEIKILWDSPQNFNTLVMAARHGFIQGITDIDIIVTHNGADWETVDKNIRLTWHDDGQHTSCEFAYADISDVKGALGLIVQVNEANYQDWCMYSVYELELYDLKYPECGETKVVHCISKKT